MTFLMHAVNAQSDRMVTAPTPAGANLPRQGQGAPEGTASEVPTPSSAQNTPAPSQSARSEQQEDPASSQQEEQLDSWVPVVSSVLEVAKKSLWMADVSFSFNYLYLYLQVMLVQLFEAVARFA